MWHVLLFSLKLRYEGENWSKPDMYLALKVLFATATSTLLKPSNRIYLTFIQRNSHPETMAT